jgi:Amidases related to nicotinamidase
MNPVLLLVDIQNDYFPGGAMELDGSEAAGGKAAELLSAFRSRKLPVIHVRHVSARPGSTFFLPGTKGADIRPCVLPEGGEAVFVKHFPNSFRETQLLDSLRELNPDRLVIAGMMTHMCIDTTVRAAADLGLQLHPCRGCLRDTISCLRRDCRSRGSCPGGLPRSSQRFRQGRNGRFDPCLSSLNAGERSFSRRNFLLLSGTGKMIQYRRRGTPFLQPSTHPLRKE